MAETTRSATSGDDTPRKSPARKTAGKKTAAKKTTSKKAAAEKTASKRTASKRTASKQAASNQAAAPPPEADGASGPKAAPRGAQVALVGAEQLVELTGKEFEGIVGIAKSEDGWTIEVEVLEMRRIPTTTDVLAAYEVTLDQGGDLVGYRRLDRYVRGSAREERQ